MRNFLSEIGRYGFRIALNNLLLSWVMNFIGAKSFRVGYKKNAIHN